MITAMCWVFKQKAWLSTPHSPIYRMINIIHYNQFRAFEIDLKVSRRNFVTDIVWGLSAWILNFVLNEA